jgi:ABC-2 type transport system ATP-binding protein
MLCGLIKPSSGSGFVQGFNLNNQLEENQKSIGVVPQEIALYPTLTAFENLQYIGNMYGLKVLT